MSKDYRMHPVFGILTDPEEIAIFDRQQAEEDMERAYWEAQQQAEYEYYWMLFMQENEMITD